MKKTWKKILQNGKGGQAWNKIHQEHGVNRRVKDFSITWQDVERVFNEQGGKSKWLRILINPDDVFKTYYPLSPSLDRLDNQKDYSPDNICISTRFENYGFNMCNEQAKHECISRIMECEFK